VKSETVHIRKYPNRRLYDTSRSRHLTQEGVIALVAEGNNIQVTDSRTGADITSAVLLQILLEREPMKVASIPAELVLRVMRTEQSSLATHAARALSAWASTAGHHEPMRGVAS
jgi:polyhydroxyalkanoate synthesis repressor PhaR